MGDDPIISNQQVCTKSMAIDPSGEQHMYSDTVSNMAAFIIELKIRSNCCQTVSFMEGRPHESIFVLEFSGIGRPGVPTAQSDLIQL